LKGKIVKLQKTSNVDQAIFNLLNRQGFTNENVSALPLPQEDATRLPSLSLSSGVVDNHPAVVPVQIDEEMAPRQETVNGSVTGGSTSWRRGVKSDNLDLVIMVRPSH